jgi:hypothetical protein
MQDVIPLHAQETRVDIGADVTKWVPNVQADPGYVREHVEYIEFAVAWLR